MENQKLLFKLEQYIDNIHFIINNKEIKEQLKEDLIKISMHGLLFIDLLKTQPDFTTENIQNDLLNEMEEGMINYMTLVDTYMKENEISWSCE